MSYAVELISPEEKDRLYETYESQIALHEQSGNLRLLHETPN